MRGIFGLKKAFLMLILGLGAVWLSQIRHFLRFLSTFLVSNWPLSHCLYA